MRTFTLRKVDPMTLTSIDLYEEAMTSIDNPTLEAYVVEFNDEGERAEVLYFGDRDIAGVAWGADPTWHEGVHSAQEACEREFGDGTEA